MMPKGSANKIVVSTEAPPPATALHYTGINGAWFVHVPAKDLDAEATAEVLAKLAVEWDCTPVAALERLLASGLYTIKDD